MTTVTLTDLTKTFDEVQAVKGIDLTINDEEFLVIVGPSGCGKSTTLRLIAGLEQPTNGDIRMGGKPVTAVPPDQRDVAMVFQNYALYPHMTGRQNITFGLKSASDFTDEEIDRRVENAASILDIADLLDRKPAAMSGGERQRVALGRAIVRDPAAFLLDEPLSNLDAKLRIQMRAELTQLHEELQTTTIYVTHDQTEAMTLGDRVAVMRDGRIEQVDPPQRLYDRPATRFVAEFIGDPAMNVIDVGLDQGHASHEAFRLPLPGNEPPFDRDIATLGIRPEDLYLLEDRPAADTVHFPATVTVREPLGDTQVMHCQVGETELTVVTEPRQAIETGDQITLTYDPARLHLFDPETGAAFYHSTVEQTEPLQQ